MTSHGTYSSAFFDQHRDGARRSADCIIPIVTELLHPTSAVDVGCGTGLWVSKLIGLGVDAVGVDGSYIGRENLEFPPERFHERDLATAEWDLGRTFDLVLSLEVAEHLPEGLARPFIEKLTALAPAVLFSAAIPMQGGTRHVNEQWQSYWRELFEDREFLALDLVRPRIWTDPRVEFWYAQNTFLYVGRDQAAAMGVSAEQSPPLMDIVHPELYRRQNKLRSHPARGRITERLSRRAGRRRKD